MASVLAHSRTGAIGPSPWSTQITTDPTMHCAGAASEESYWRRPHANLVGSSPRSSRLPLGKRNTWDFPARRACTRGHIVRAWTG
jgi:hypothetical protein